jgi:NADH-quinone oxidoreductase subunit C
MTEQSNGGEGEAPAGEEKAAPVRRGPPIVVAEEVLDERGEQAAALLKGVLGDLALESGGREDTPWALVDAARLHEAAKRCRDEPALLMDMLHCEFAVDYEDRIQMIYVLYSTPQNHKAVLRVNLPADKPEVDTVTDLWTVADWYERETHDLFGVEFPGNADLSPLLLYEGFEGHPGLKSFPLHDYEEW